MCELWQKKSMCDLVLVSMRGDVNFPVHRVVLCAQSDYLKRLFASQDADVTTGGLYAVVIEVDVEARALEALICLSYTGRMALSHANVASIMSAAQVLDMPMAQKVCRDFTDLSHASGTAADLGAVSDSREADEGRSGE
jgi:hypothetical protein